MMGSLGTTDLSHKPRLLETARSRLIKTLEEGSRRIEDLMPKDEVLEVFFSLDAKQTKRGASLQFRMPWEPYASNDVQPKNYGQKNEHFSNLEMLDDGSATSEHIQVDFAYFHNDSG